MKPVTKSVLAEIVQGFSAAEIADGLSKQDRLDLLDDFVAGILDPTCGDAERRKILTYLFFECLQSRPGSLEDDYEIVASVFGVEEANDWLEAQLEAEADAGRWQKVELAMEQPLR